MPDWLITEPWDPSIKKMWLESAEETREAARYVCECFDGEEPGKTFAAALIATGGYERSDEAYAYIVERIERGGNIDSLTALKVLEVLQLLPQWIVERESSRSLILAVDKLKYSEEYGLIRSLKRRLGM